MILDIFKKKKPKPAEVKPVALKKSLSTTTKNKPTTKRLGESLRVLKTPHITEKAGDLASKNQYIFKVWPEVNKIEIKKTIERIYGVKVLSVRIIKVLPKKRKLGRISGWTKGYKKAIVKIKEGQKIELLPR